MSRVWIVTSGCYSDYHIVGVFDTKQAATAFADKYSATIWGDGFEIEEWSLNELANHVPYIEVTMDRNGNVTRVYPVRHKTPDTVQKDYCPDGGGDWHYFVDTDEPEHAVKVANERRVMRIAVGGGKC